MTAPVPERTPPVTDRARARGEPAQSPHRSPNDMLAPSAAAPQTPGAPGLAGELPSEPVTHRRTPAAQNPERSEHWFPPVSD